MKGSKITNDLINPYGIKVPLKAKKKSKSLIRLYCFHNFVVGGSGKPFALCDLHRDTQKIPETCMLEKIADKAISPCVQCEEIDG